MSGMPATPFLFADTAPATPLLFANPAPSTPLCSTTASVGSTKLGKQERQTLALKAAARDAFSQIRRRREEETQQVAPPPTVLSSFQSLVLMPDTLGYLRQGTYKSARPAVAPRTPTCEPSSCKVGMPMMMFPGAVIPAATPFKTGGVDNLWGLYSSEVHHKKDAFPPALHDVDDQLPTPTRQRKSQDSSGIVALEAVSEDLSHIASDGSPMKKRNLDSQSTSPGSSPKSSLAAASVTPLASSKKRRLSRKTSLEPSQVVGIEGKSPRSACQALHDSQTESQSVSKTRRLNKKTCMGDNHL